MTYFKIPTMDACSDSRNLWKATRWELKTETSFPQSKNAKLCFTMYSQVLKRRLFFFCVFINLTVLLAVSSSYQVMELYSGETHHIVPQFLPCKKKPAIRIMEGCGNRVSCW